jgi:signal transduction histidine kinase
VAREFARLDGRLLWQAGLVLVGALAITGSALGWAFRRLDLSNRLLARRTEDLQRANQELARSARIASLGAVTAHLIHGLKNPVTGLQSFVASRPDAGAADDEAWRDALAATRRMQGLIDHVVGVLREHESDLAYEVSLREVGEAVLGRVHAFAQARNVRLALEGNPSVTVDNRTSGLLALLLTNLMENGIEATPGGRQVTLRLGTDGDRYYAEVADEGTGLAPEVRGRLFQPQRSTKEGGSGLGLAITRQLALALGGEVRLLSTAADGTVFRAELPRDALGAPTAAGVGSAGPGA